MNMFTFFFFYCTCNVLISFITDHRLKTRHVLVMHKPRPCKLTFIRLLFECHAHISTSNQQPMYRTKVPSYIYSFPIICLTWTEENICHYFRCIVTLNLMKLSENTVERKSSNTDCQWNVLLHNDCALQYNQ